MPQVVAVPDLATVAGEMLSVLTGMVLAPLHVLVMPHHVHALAPRSALLPPRGGTTGGYWGLAHGGVVMALGLLVLLARRLLDLHPPADWGGFAIGTAMIGVGLTVAYRTTRLEAHDHPHLHGVIEHEHVHLHAAPDQVHDHDQPAFGILYRVFDASNLVGAVPVLVLAELRGVLYLVSYLVFSILAMGSLGYWLGQVRRGGNDVNGVLRLGTLIGRATTALGLVWVVTRWPF